MGFGLTEGGYLLYCEGLPLPVLIPESQVDLGVTSAEPLHASIYPDRDTALADLAVSTSDAGQPRYACLGSSRCSGLLAPVPPRMRNSRRTSNTYGR
ncbi:putative Reticuline oxidase precursor [Cystobacter fuscus DSM 2262]|uniref:Reticuline oxidase n=1 Tax=Cystobacter fuscus (strain ATCC 25194 / DSM 2262 / NBRC 100088 / M29) TaxID=1242864 RepID=S9P7T7_CYSF2|nr:putative Reticuline oxidase precursor [Cystobacter fuscus DSM 2262]